MQNCSRQDSPCPLQVGEGLPRGHFPYSITWDGRKQLIFYLISRSHKDPAHGIDHGTNQVWKHEWEQVGPGMGMEGISPCWELMLALPGTQAEATQFKLAPNFHDPAPVCVLLPLLLVVLAWSPGGEQGGG